MVGVPVGGGGHCMVRVPVGDGVTVGDRAPL